MVSYVIINWSLRAQRDDISQFEVISHICKVLKVGDWIVLLLIRHYNFFQNLFNKFFMIVDIGDKLV